MFISSALAATAPVSGAAATGVFPPFDTSTFASQLFWLAITFGALYFALSKIAIPRVAEILDARSAKIASDLDAANGAKKAADDAGAAYDKSLSDAKASAQQNVQSLRDKLHAETEAKRKALESDLAAEAASAIVRQVTGRDADAKLIEDAVKG